MGETVDMDHRKIITMPSLLLLLHIYVVQGYYFKVDTIRQMADWWMDNRQSFLNEVAKNDIFIIKYLDHEKELWCLITRPRLP